MKKAALLILLLVLLSFISGFALFSNADAKTITLRGGHGNSDEAPTHLTMKMWADLVSKRTNGAVDIKVFGGDQLGSQRARVQSVKMGTLEWTVADASQVADVFPAIGVLDCPYIYKDMTHYKAVLRSKLFTELAQECSEKSGVLPIASTFYGRRHLVANKIVRSPIEAKGLLIRTPEAELLMDAIRAIGATPTPVAFSEAYLAIKQGVVDGGENPLSTIWDAKWFEVTKYAMLTEHVYNNELIAFNSRLWQTFTPEQQKIIKESMEEAADWELAYQIENENKFLSLLEGKGMKIIRLTSAELDKFRKNAESFIPKKYEKEWAGYYDRITSLGK